MLSISFSSLLLRYGLVVDCLHQSQKRYMENDQQDQPSLRETNDSVPSQATETKVTSTERLFSHPGTLL